MSHRSESPGYLESVLTSFFWTVLILFLLLRCFQLRSLVGLWLNRYNKCLLLTHFLPVKLALVHRVVSALAGLTFVIFSARKVWLSSLRVYLPCMNEDVFIICLARRFCCNEDMWLILLNPSLNQLLEFDFKGQSFAIGLPQGLLQTQRDLALVHQVLFQQRTLTELVSLIQFYLLEIIPVF